MGRKSTHALGKSAKPYSQISDGQKVKVKGQANIPTKRQKTDMASLVASVVGGAFGKPIVMLAKSLSKPMLEKALQPLTRSKTQPSRKAIKEQLTKIKKPDSKPTPQKGEAARLRHLNRAQALKKKPRKEPAYKTLKREESREVAARTSRLSKKKQAENLRKLKEEQNKPTPPKNKPTPPKNKPTPPKRTPPPTSAAALTATATGVGGLASLDNKKKKKRKVVGSGQTPATGYVESKKPKRKAKDSGRDSDLLDTPAGVTSGKTPKKAYDGYRYYGKKGTGLGDFSRKYGIKYATQEQFDKDFGNVDGAYEGGPLKKLAKKRRKGFSGRGAGKALRGF